MTIKKLLEIKRIKKLSSEVKTKISTLIHTELLDNQYNAMHDEILNKLIYFPLK